MLGPNVWIGSGATVKAGVRLVNCIILQNAEILVRWDGWTHLSETDLCSRSYRRTDKKSSPHSILGQENAFIKNAIVGWNAVVGSWARIEGREMQ